MNKVIRSAGVPHASFSPARRDLLLGLGAALTLGRSRAAFAQAPGEQRLVVVLLRGALDGLHVVQPYADPGLATLRRALALPEPGREHGLLDLGGRFGLHPAMAGLHGLYRQNQALIVHAVAGSYRSRSHFDGQDLLEAGAEERLTSGWLNRALQAMPTTARARPGLAVGMGVPLLLRGPTPVGSYVPPELDRPSADLMHLIAALQPPGSPLGRAFEEGMRSRVVAGSALGAVGDAPEQNSFGQLAGAAGRLLAERDGPRVAALEIGGWDTHAVQTRRIVPPLRMLDNGLMRLRQALGLQWAQTAVLVITEFGRTARVNGNLGTDHGTGSVAFLLGGAVAGGKVAGDFPGLSRDALFEDRDLRPTTDLRSVAKALLRDHLRPDPRAVAQAFPGSDAIAPMGGLVQS
jgi:uncharacterized protein (DUF1501 family)